MVHLIEDNWEWKSHIFFLLLGPEHQGPKAPSYSNSLFLEFDRDAYFKSWRARTAEDLVSCISSPPKNFGKMPERAKSPKFDEKNEKTVPSAGLANEWDWKELNETSPIKSYIEGYSLMTLSPLAYNLFWYLFIVIHNQTYVSFLLKYGWLIVDMRCQLVDCMQRPKKEWDRNKFKLGRQGFMRFQRCSVKVVFKSLTVCSITYGKVTTTTKAIIKHEEVWTWQEVSLTVYLRN